MPFGHRCEYVSFNACVSDQRRKGYSEEASRRICGTLQRDTEEKCRGRSKRVAPPRPEDEKPVYHYGGPSV